MATVTASRIRVADAPLLDRATTRATRTVEAAPPAADDRFARGIREAFYRLMTIAIIVNFSAFLLSPTMPHIYPSLVIMRYLEWPLVVLAILAHLGKHGPAHIGRTLLPLIPFLLIGVLAGIIGYDPAASLKLLIVWTLVVVFAASTGAELAPETVAKTIFWIMLLMTVSSAITALAAPDIGLEPDPRMLSGSWRGLFQGKNLLGLICAYSVVLSLVVRPPMWARLFSFVAAFACLPFVGSQGGTLTAILATGLILSIIGLRRNGLAPVTNIIVLLCSVTVGIITVWMGAQPLLELMGRDPTLTGRTTIWHDWFTLAKENWLTGTGPGSFTTPSTVTANLSLINEALGTIHSPHNMFLAAFGETGVFGAIAMALPLIYMMVILPLTHSRSRPALVTAGVAAAMVIGGLGEAREVFGFGMNMFLLVLVYSGFVRTTATDAPVAEPFPGPGAAPSRPQRV